MYLDSSFNGLLLRTVYGSHVSSGVVHVFYISAIIVCVALYERMLGQAPGESLTIGTGSWCWVKCLDDDPNKTMIYMLVTGKGFEILCYLLSATFYVLLKFKLVYFLLKGKILYRYKVCGIDLCFS